MCHSTVAIHNEQYIVQIGLYIFSIRLLSFSMSFVCFFSQSEKNIPTFLLFTRVKRPKAKFIN